MRKPIRRNIVAALLMAAAVAFGFAIGQNPSSAAERLKLEASKPLDVRVADLEAKVRELQSKTIRLEEVLKRVTTPGPQLIAR